eukprot:4827223-Pleurochrysis_carterae.AAC.3
MGKGRGEVVRPIFTSNALKLPFRASQLGCAYRCCLACESPPTDHQHGAKPPEKAGRAVRILVH